MEVRDLKIGTRLELEILGIDGERIGNTYISQLIEPVRDRSLIISTPIYESRLIFVPVNGKVRITFFHSRYGLQGFTALVTAREQRENLSVICIEAEEQPQKIQRRTYYRLDCTLNVEYRIFEGYQPNKETKKPRYTKALTRNISGSGICIVVNEEIKKHTSLEIFVSISETVKIRALCNVLRCTQKEKSSNPKYELGLHFTEITTQSQDSIIKYIFEQQRLLLKKDVL